MGMLDSIGVDIGSFGGFGFAGLGNSLMISMIGIIFVAVLGIGGYLIYDWKLYKKKIEIFENLSGVGYVRTGFDRAKLVKVGDGGEEILRLKKRKCFRTAYGKKMGRETYWFAIGQDGYWYNVVLGDLDAKQGELDIEPIDRDMRYMHVAIRKNIQDRYRSHNFMDKYGSYMIMGIFFLLMVGSWWFLIDKIGDASSGNAAAAQASERTVILLKDVLSSMDNVCGGSGITPAG